MTLFSTHTKDISKRFYTFIGEQFPFLLPNALKAFQQGKRNAQKTAEILRNCPPLQENCETTPFVLLSERLSLEFQKLQQAVEGFFERETLYQHMGPAEKIQFLKGMILTRAVDNTCKRLFLSGEIYYKDRGFQGKGFRSLGQEAIYASTFFLQKGDYISPMIRDAGAVLSFTDDDIEMLINGQMGKAGPPLEGKDLHVGDLKKGVLPPAAPLAIGVNTLTGMALSARLRQEPAVFVSYIGEGGTSLGEWHEAINFASVQKLPMVFCVQNNQTALSTPLSSQSSCRVFAEKALGYGIPHLSLDGTDPEAIAVAFGWGSQIARSGKGPVLLELISMRMCGHAHHDDMLYLGHEPELSFDYPGPKPNGYVEAETYAKWAKKDPITTYGQQLIHSAICSEKDIQVFKQEALEKCQQAVDNIKHRPWPQLSPLLKHVSLSVKIQEPPTYHPKGKTYLEAIILAVEKIFQQYPNAYILGEDVAPPYGNAFMLFKNISFQYKERFINTPISENAIIGSSVGMALSGLRPIAEIQFNDFVASGFNQLVNNAAKFFFRTGHKVPMVIRMPWGGLRRAGPYHSQDTAPWFYRTAGLKIIAPSTPSEAYALLQAAVAEEDPVLFYEHIALYRDPSLRQNFSESYEFPIGKSVYRQRGNDLTIISYGAYVHRVLSAVQSFSSACEVIDLCTLSPLDFETLSESIQHTGKVLLVGEDSKTGSILQSVAGRIGEELFMDLDAPIRVLGALDMPVPYSPSLEDAYLVSEADIQKAVLELLEW